MQIDMGQSDPTFQIDDADLDFMISSPISFVVLASRVGQGSQLSERSTPECPGSQSRLKLAELLQVLENLTYNNLKDAAGGHTSLRLV